MDVIIPLLFLGFYLVCGVWASKEAKKKKRSQAGWFFAGLFLPIISNIVLAFLKSLGPEQDHTKRTDPYETNYICPRCRGRLRYVPVGGIMQGRDISEALEPRYYYCRSCGWRSDDDQ
jgi:hypothetical protein